MKSKSMRASAVFILIAVFSLGEIGCSRSSRYYIEHGNKLFEAGKYDDAALNFRKAIQKDNRSGEAYYQLGLAELKLRNGVGAYQALTHAEELLPDRDDVKVTLGDVLLGGYLTDPRRPQKLYDELTRLSRELLAKNPNSFDGLRFKGDLARTDGKLKDAIELFAKANAVRPMQPNVVAGWVEALIKDGQFPEAEQRALELIQKHKDFGPIYDVLYALYMASNRVAEAEGLLKKKVSNNPEDKQAIFQLARHYDSLKKSAEASSALQELIDNPKTFPEARAEVGDYYLGSRNWDEALRQYNQGLHDNPKDTRYKKRISNALIAQGKTDEALQMLDQIVREEPKDLEARSLRAVLLLNSGKQLDTALSELRDLVNQLPGDEILRFNLGRAYMVTGDWNDARTEFLQAAKQKDTYLPPRIELAALGERRHDYAETLRYADEVRALNPRDPGGRLWHCVGLIGTGSYNQAHTEVNALIRDFPQSLDVLLLIGRLDMAEKKYKEAEVTYSKLYRASQNDLRPLEGMVNALAEQQQFEPAIQLLNNELKRSPNSQTVHASLAFVAVRAGKLDLAINQYQWLIENNPKDTDAYIRLSSIYQAKGDRRNAIARLQDARKLEPKNPQVLALIAFLENSTGQSTEAQADYRHHLAMEPGDPVTMNNLAFLIADTGGSLDEALNLAVRARQKLPDSPGIADTLGWIYVKKNMNDSAIQVLSQLVKKFPDQPEFRYHLGMALLQKGDKQSARTELEVGLAKQPPQDMAEKIKAAILKSARVGSS